MRSFLFGKIHLIVALFTFGLLSSNFASHGHFNNTHSNYQPHCYKNNSLLLIDKINSTNGNSSHKVRLEQGSQPAKLYHFGLLSHLQLGLDFSESDIEMEEDCDANIDLRLNSTEDSFARTFDCLFINQKYSLTTNHFISAVWRPPQY